MADIEQNLQEIEQERSRLITAKANLKTAIAGKGVTVADDVKLDQYYTFVNNIQGGEGGSSELPQIELSDLNISEAILTIEGPAQVPEITGFDMRMINGVGDLDAENIAYGKTICGITGTFGGSIPGTSGNYTLPDDFRLNLKIAYWKNYEPVQMDLMIFSGDEYVSGTNRIWISADNAFFLDYTNGRWTIRYNNTELGSVYEVATNSTLSKHGWGIIDTPIHPTTNVEYDFISLEDKDWTYSG